MASMTKSEGEESIPHAGVAGGEAVPEVRIGDPAWMDRYGGQVITLEGEELVLLAARDVLVVDGSDPAPGDSGTSLAARLEKLLHEVAMIRSEEADDRRPALLQAMMASGIDPVPAETIAQARRLARRRGRLLASGAYSTDALRELRQDSTPSATRTWMSRRRGEHELITVTHEGRTLIPAFQLNEEGGVRSSVSDALRALVPAQLSGWAAWTWFTAGSAWLGGAAPLDLLDTDPQRVARAAARFAANAA